MTFYKDQLRNNLERTREMLDSAEGVPLETFRILDGLFQSVYAIYLEAAGVISSGLQHGGGPQVLSMQELYDKMKADGVVKDDAETTKVEKKVENIGTGQYL